MNLCRAADPEAEHGSASSEQQKESKHRKDDAAGRSPKEDGEKDRKQGDASEEGHEPAPKSNPAKTLAGIWKELNDDSRDSDSDGEREEHEQVRDQYLQLCCHTVSVSESQCCACQSRACRLPLCWAKSAEGLEQENLHGTCDARGSSQERHKYLSQRARSHRGTERHLWCMVQEAASIDGADGEQAPQARIVAYSDSDSDDELPKLPFRRRKKEDGAETADDDPNSATGAEEKKGLLPWRGWNKPDKTPQVRCLYTFHRLPLEFFAQAFQC